MNYRELAGKLKDMGFVLVEHKGTKHEMWWNNKVKIFVPRKRIINIRTAKRILKQAEVESVS